MHPNTQNNSRKQLKHTIRKKTTIHNFIHRRNGVNDKNRGRHLYINGINKPHAAVLYIDKCHFKWKKTNYFKKQVDKKMLMWMKKYVYIIWWNSWNSWKLMQKFKWCKKIKKINVKLPKVIKINEKMQNNGSWWKIFD